MPGGRLREMERVDAYRVDEGLPPEKVEAVNCRHAPVVRRSQGGEAPQLLAGYLGRIGRSRLLARGGVGPQSPSEIRQRAGAPDREKPEAHGLGRQEVPRHGTAVRGAYPGGQHRPNEGRRQVRSRDGPSIFYLRYLVDNVSDSAGHRMRVPSPGTLSTRSVAPTGSPPHYWKVAQP
jgi:hypothetical protein